MNRIIYLLFILTISSNIFAEAMTVKGYGTLIEIPVGWVMVNYGSGPLAYQLLSPIENERDFFQENITCTYEVLSNGKTLENVLKRGKKELQEGFTDFKLLNEEKKSGSEAILEFEHNENGNIMRSKQLIIKGGNKAYIVTATGLTNTYPDYEMTFERLFRTFKILK